MKKIYLVTALACCALQPTLAQKQEECKPVNLHCDHLINPLGIDNANPRLSWMLNDARQGARQTAYQIIVSTDSLKANNENGEIWNSGEKRIGSNPCHLSGKESSTLYQILLESECMG